MILLAYGTRPEYIKIKPLIDIFDREGFPYRVLFTGQHIQIGAFGHDYAINIMDGENRLDSIVASTMNRLTSILRIEKDITHVLVQGDTTSVLAVALSAFHHGIKVIHLEAGLRTYDRDNPYPEETNRRMVSLVSDIHLCPTENNFKNLVNEKIYGSGDIFQVGNTVLDNLLPYKDKCEYASKVLVTMHRRENHHWMDVWFKEIDLLAEQHPELEFILPMHPNPNVQKHRGLLEHIKVVEPMSHDELLELLVKTRIVITDSGGIQEECSFFNKKCLTCRKVTERPEAIGQSTFMVKRPEDLNAIFNEQISNYEINYECPFGDGNSAEKIFNVLKDLV